jgi:hypothetical protein
MTARGTAANIALGPGRLYIAPLGSVEPVDLTTAWASVDAGWVLLGYTDAGSEFDYSLSTDPVNVAEELDPLQVTTTGRAASVKFALAELTATNLKRASNGGTIGSLAGGAAVYFEPPALGTEVRTMLGFEAEDHTERWIYRQCFQTGNATITRAKGASNATISTEFTLEKPTTGLALYRAILSNPQRFI